MKKFYYVVGAAVTAASIFLALAVLLKKLRISLSIEGIDDEYLAEPDNDDIELSIEQVDSTDSFDPAQLDALLEDDEPEIEVEISEE